MDFSSPSAIAIRLSDSWSVFGEGHPGGLAVPTGQFGGQLLTAAQRAP